MSGVTRDPWAKLRAVTPARVGLGRSGAGLTTQTHLGLQLAHARARDAVHSALDIPRLTADLAPLPCIEVASAATDRATYLRRPDMGRTLAHGAEALDGHPRADVAIVIADGLSPEAVQTHAAPVTHAIIDALPDLAIAPVVIASQARVAIGDAIGERLGVRLVILLVGERPGLTVAESLGAYLTYGPKPGIRDSLRNCISNIHGKGGLSHTEAAHKIAWLTRAALRLELTGTALKEDAGQIAGENSTQIR